MTLFQNKLLSSHNIAVPLISNIVCRSICW